MNHSTKTAALPLPRCGRAGDTSTLSRGAAPHVTGLRGVGRGTLLLSLVASMVGSGCGPQPPEETTGANSVAVFRDALHLEEPPDALHAPKPKKPQLRFRDETGVLLTVTASGTYDLDNPFFQSLGTNGRACVTCHEARTGFSITPARIQERFEESRGRDPIFASVDGTNSPTAPMSTLAERRANTTMLRTRGVIRVGLPIPANAEFSLVAVDDPYGHANASDLSLFRRPLPTTNLKFLSAVMWDGRETQPGAAMPVDLQQQAIDATLQHAQAAAPGLTPEQAAQVVEFETDLFTAQVEDDRAGLLTRDGALGGPKTLVDQPFHIGINDVLGADPSGAPFDSTVFTLYGSWLNDCNERRAKIARGEQLFNTRTFTVSGVKGLNDKLGVPSLTVTCTTCHDAPNAGDHSVALPLDLGLTDASRRTADQPLYTLQNNVTGETLQTTDPGRALVTGKWADIGKFKGPILRGLAARPPYFHNGSAAQLKDVVDFYDSRFGAHFTPEEKASLVAFLHTL